MTADIICHGTPSPLAFQGWLAALESFRGMSVVRYDHRPKNTGWGHVERIVWEDGTVEQQTRWADAWRRYFYDDRSLRPSCYQCPYTKTVRDSDITIADFWGVEGTTCARPDDGALGVSLVLANTPQGLRVLSHIDADLIEAKLESAIPGNPMLLRPTSSKGDRKPVWASLYRDGMLGMMRRNRFLLSPAIWVAVRARATIKRLLRR